MKITFPFAIDFLLCNLRFYAVCLFLLFSFLFQELIPTKENEHLALCVSAYYGGILKCWPTKELETLGSVFTLSFREKESV